MVCEPFLSVRNRLSNLNFNVVDLKGLAFFNVPDPLPRCINRTNPEIMQIYSIDNDEKFNGDSHHNHNGDRIKLSLEFGSSTCQTKLSYYICAEHLIKENDDIQILNVKIPVGFSYSGGTEENHEVLDITRHNSENNVEFLLKLEHGQRTCILVEAERNESPTNEELSTVEIYDVLFSGI